MFISQVVSRVGWHDERIRHLGGCGHHPLVAACDDLFRRESSSRQCVARNDSHGIQKRG
jgi:hypothetical protein